MQAAEDRCTDDARSASVVAPVRTLYVFFVITRERRAIVHWNVTQHPTAAWVWQQIREATPWGQHPRYLIRDPISDAIRIFWSHKSDR